MSDKGLVIEILRQIQDALQRIERRFAPVSAPDDFLSTDEGTDRLDSICMMLIAIGESLKNLDRITAVYCWRAIRLLTGKGQKGFVMLFPTIILI